MADNAMLPQYGRNAMAGFRLSEKDTSPYQYRRHLLLPAGENPYTGEVETATPGLVQGAIDAFTLPSRAMGGEVAPDQMVPEAFNFAGNVALGGYMAPKPAGSLGMSGGGKAAEQQGIRAYHGSPHDFDKFDLSRIGTGEGAQAYGHGLYFAENEGVAKSYREQLAGPSIPAGPHTPKTTADLLLYDAGGDVKSAIRSAHNKKFQLKQIGKGKDDGHFDDVITLLESGAADALPSNGKMYEVRINADPAHFLDWDKPLSQQPNVAGMVGRDEQGRLMLPNGERADPNTLRGESFYRAFAEARGGGTQAGSDAIREAGIPGIRYLDQGSRGAGEGSSNYVVFDDKLIEILRKYGLAGMIGGGAAANSMMPGDAPQPAAPSQRGFY